MAIVFLALNIYFYVASLTEFSHDSAESLKPMVTRHNMMYDMVELWFVVRTFRCKLKISELLGNLRLSTVGTVESNRRQRYYESIIAAADQSKIPGQLSSI